LFYNNFVYFGLIYLVNTHQPAELSEVPVMDAPIVSRSGKSVVLAAQKTCSPTTKPEIVVLVISMYR
jgi:hypothetical protein